MRIKVKLFAWLRAAAPAGSDHGRIVLDLSPGSTVAEALASVGLSAEEAAGGLILLRNGLHVFGDTRLEEGDVLSVFPPLAGGSSRRCTTDKRLDGPDSQD